MLCGLDRVTADQTVLKGRRFGLLMNQASIDSRWRYADEALAETYPGQLQALFTPQHGLWGEQQANMIESPHGRHGAIPVYSLYSETRRPTPQMLEAIDLLVVDLQDVGTRVYTFVWTMLECLRACAECGVAVMVLDRPNPLGGLVFEGPTLEKEYESFVGGHPIPLRHGLTVGELARLLVRELRIDCQLEVVDMPGWRRASMYDATGLPWIPPSPNMPRWETALLYPGLVLLEGTNISEGRGTTRPFEMVGAPFVEPNRLLETLNACQLPGVKLLPIRFHPTFDKHAGQSCGGVAIHVEDPSAVRSVELACTIIAAIRKHWPDQFAWLDPPYEYETEKLPIDILAGGSWLRAATDGAAELEPGWIGERCAAETDDWRGRIDPIMLYG